MKEMKEVFYTWILMAIILVPVSTLLYFTSHTPLYIILLFGLTTGLSLNSRS